MAHSEFPSSSFSASCHTLSRLRCERPWRGRNGERCGAELKGCNIGEAGMKCCEAGDGENIGEAGVKGCWYGQYGAGAGAGVGVGGVLDSFMVRRRSSCIS